MWGVTEKVCQTGKDCLLTWADGLSKLAQQIDRTAYRFSVMCTSTVHHFMKRSIEAMRWPWQRVSNVCDHDLKGQCHDIQWYFALFCASKKWRLLAQVSRTSDHDMLDQPREELHRLRRVEQKSFSSRKCHFPRPSLVAAIIFPHTKWLPKITDYRDTAALKRQCHDNNWWFLSAILWGEK